MTAVVLGHFTDRALERFVASRSWKTDKIEKDGDNIHEWVQGGEGPGLYKYANLDIDECLEKNRSEWQDLAAQWRVITATQDASNWWEAKYTAAAKAICGYHPITRLVGQVLQDLKFYMKEYNAEKAEVGDFIATQKAIRDKIRGTMPRSAFNFPLMNLKYATMKSLRKPMSFHAHLLPSHYAGQYASFANNLEILSQFENSNDFTAFENMLMSAQINLRFRAGTLLRQFVLVQVEGMVENPLQLDEVALPFFRIPPIDHLNESKYFDSHDTILCATSGSTRSTCRLKLLVKCSKIITTGSSRGSRASSWTASTCRTTVVTAEGQL